MSHKFDVIVVGAGPAGLAAAYEVARRGYKVLILERGKRPGAKNLYGGRIYVKDIEKFIPDIVKDLYKIGRQVIRECIMLTHEKTCLYTTIESDSWNGGIIVSLTRFVELLSQKVENAGAYIVTSARVDALNIQGGKISGVRCGVDTITADFVVDSEGVNRILLENSGLCRRLTPEEVAIGVKEVYRLDPKDTNKLFDLDEDRGLTLFAIGEVLGYLPGGAFLYTDRSHIHIGVVLYLSSYYKIRSTIPQILENMYRLPIFRNVVKYGERVEYGARIIPVAPLQQIPPVDGLVVVGDAGGYLVHVGPIIRGVDYAILSGICSGKAIVDVLEKEKKTTYSLFRQYVLKYLRETPLLRDLELFRKVYSYYKADDLYRKYVGFIVDFMRNYMEVKDGIMSMNEAFYTALRKHGLSIWSLTIDYIKRFRKM